MAIHDTAIIHEGAEIDASADIGPFCIVGPRVKIGPMTRLLSHVVVDNDTTIGARNIIYPHAVVGGTPQDLKFKGEPSRLIIGDDNVIREGATLHIGTATGRMETKVGNNCLLMGYTHVAHDCILGDHVIMANMVGLAGHVDIDDAVILGGLSGVQQFCRIGRNAYITGGALVTQSVPPFCVAKGDRARLVSINNIGLGRAGWSRHAIDQVRHAFQALFQSDVSYAHTIDQVERELAKESPEVAELCAFIRAEPHGVCPGRRGATLEDEA